MTLGFSMNLTKNLEMKMAVLLSSLLLSRVLGSTVFEGMTTSGCLAALSCVGTDVGSGESTKRK
jgi:hypothetical protein